MPKLKNAEIAARINEHLKRFEADPEINKINELSSTSPYWLAHCWASGRWIYVKYINYRSEANLTKEEALIYLE